MNKKCLYCYKPIDSKEEFHESCALAFFGTKQIPVLPYGLREMKDLAKNIVEKRIAVPGVQPKLSLTLIDNITQKAETRFTVVGALGGNYTLKPPTDHYPEMPANEHLTMRIAEAFGIRVVPSTLIRLQSGELSYLTKRIDRKASAEKIHMVDMYQITEAYDKYKSSMERIGKALNNYSNNTLLDKVFFFELAVFSFLVGNNDMHLKNFSMIQSPSGWVLAPAYDLLNFCIVNPKDLEEMALTINGKKSKLNKADFVHLGTNLNLNNKQIKGVFNRMLKNKPKAIELINHSFLSDTMKTAYINLLEKRYNRI